MTQLLVSVRSAAEARLALAGGVDWIDVKEPARGSLGRAELIDIAAVLSEVARQKPVSIALGELREWNSATSIEWRGIAAAKLGLSRIASLDSWRAQLRAAWEAFAPEVMRVAVAYADWQSAGAPSPDDILDEADRHHCGAFLLDTWDKQSGGLTTHLTEERLGILVDRARKRGMLVVVAGSLTLPMLPQILGTNPDFVAVRGAVCRAGRTSTIDAALVQAWSDALHGSAGKPSLSMIPPPRQCDHAVSRINCTRAQS